MYIQCSCENGGLSVRDPDFEILENILKNKLLQYHYAAIFMVCLVTLSTYLGRIGKYALANLSNLTTGQSEALCVNIFQIIPLNVPGLPVFLPRTVNP